MPATDLAKYVALFGEDFAPIVHALEKGLNPNVQAQVLGLLDNMTLKAEIFGAQVQSTVATLSTNGASANTIRSALKADMAVGGSIFGSLKNDVKAGIATQVNQSGRIGMMEQYAKVENFQWVTVGTKVCPDCGPRGGTTLTWDQWVSEGLPGSGWSVCRGYCYCILDGSGKLPPEVKMPVVEPRAGKASLIPPKYPKKQTFTKYDDLKGASSSYLDDVSEEILESYEKYYHSAYEDINYYARTKKFGKGWSQSLKDNTVKRYNDMVKDFANQPGFKGTSYRGSGQWSRKEFAERLAVYEENVGGMITEDMFFSSSVRPEFAAEWRAAAHDFRIEFTIKGKTGVVPNGLEMSAAESEVLFNAHTQYEVVSVTRSASTKSTWANLVDSGSLAHDKVFEEVAHVVLREI